jgi:hypothetical protein
MATAPATESLPALEGHSRGGDRPRLAIRVLLSLILGMATTLVVATALAAWAPIDLAGGTVALDGDHLQPWLLRLSRVGADRTIWFEKGRIWSKRGVGPPGGSSSAVSCWSFATATRRNPLFVRGPVETTAELRGHMERTPPTCWGVALDRRGWPIRALECAVVAPTSPSAPAIYLVNGGALDRRQIQGSQSLATVRVFPWRPVWTGLLADGAIFAVPWFLLLILAAFLSAGGRAALRLRRGHCPECGYDLCGDVAGGCPECGWRRSA